MPSSAAQLARARLISTAIIGIVSMIVTGVGLGLIAGLAFIVFRWVTG